jgi:hypothetical protein
LLKLKVCNLAYRNLNRKYEASCDLWVIFQGYNQFSKLILDELPKVRSLFVRK